MSEKRTLIDTSSWIEALRHDGNTEVRERVRELLIDGVAVWCDFVLLELWNGARGNYEKKRLAELEKEIPVLPTTENVWGLSRQLARECRNAGKTVPPTDLLIAACALHHGAALEYTDSHFEAILQIHSRATS